MEIQLSCRLSGAILLFSCTILAGPTKSGSQPGTPAPAVQQRSSAVATPLVPSQASVQTLVATNQASLQIADTWVEKLGGSVHSTGVEDIIVRIRSPQDPNGINGQRDRMLQVSPWTSGIYLISPGPTRFIGSNREGGKQINLGRIPPGELIFAITTTDGYNLQTGDASRNPDRLEHAIVRSYRSGTIEVWFEDAPGPIHTGRSDRNFTDAVIQLRGGVSDNGAVEQFLKVINEQTGETPQGAIDALKKVNPKAAAMEGIQ